MRGRFLRYSILYTRYRGIIGFVLILKFDFCANVLKKLRDNNITMLQFIMTRIYNWFLLTKDKFFFLLFVDDGALMFISRSETILETKIILRDMSKLSFVMHTDKRNKASKTEAVPFPSRTKTQSRIHIQETNMIQDLTLPLIGNVKILKLFWKLILVIDKYYVKSKENLNSIIGGDGFIFFVIYFKYLGLWISYNLNGSFDVSSRIKKANQAMGALNCFGN